MNKLNVERQTTLLGISLVNRAKTARRAGNRRIEAATDKILELAKMYAPIDEGNLESSIKKEVSNSGINGRNVYEVFIDEMAQGSNGAETVGQYALRMHESVYNLGKGSSEKDKQVGGNGYGYGGGNMAISWCSGGVKVV